MKKIVPILLLFAWMASGKAQNYMGFQLEYGVNTLTGISSDTIVPYGLSGAKTSTSRNRSFSPTIKYRRQFTERFSADIGVGYLPVEHDIELEYYYELFELEVDTVLNIDLAYLTIPLSANFRLPISERSAFQFSVGVNTNILISNEDNFEGLFLELIGFIRRDWYSKVVFSPNTAIAFQKEIKNASLLELGLFISTDMNSIIVNNDKTWGFYENLRRTHNLRYGLQFKYYFNL